MDSIEWNSNRLRRVALLNFNQVHQFTQVERNRMRLITFLLSHFRYPIYKAGCHTVQGSRQSWTLWTLSNGVVNVVLGCFGRRYCVSYCEPCLTGFTASELPTHSDWVKKSISDICSPILDTSRRLPSMKINLSFLKQKNCPSDVRRCVLAGADKCSKNLQESISKIRNVQELE